MSQALPSTSSSSSPLRFLTRPRPPSLPPPSQNGQHTSPPPSSDAGVVVVGLLSSRPAASAGSLLLNRLLDRCAFAPGDLDRDFSSGSSLGWFKHRRISYYRDDERGIVYVLFQSGPSRMRRIVMGVGEEKGSDLEHWEAEDLRGALFMFSVCHVIIFLHEGSRFDTHILKNFRMLQRAKYALTPFVRSLATPVVTSLSPSTVSQSSVPSTSSKSPGKTSGGPHGSTISLMSGPSSKISVLPGQCVPVILFVFHDEFVDGTNGACSTEDLSDSLLNQPLGHAGANRTVTGSRVSGSVVVLARPASKIENSARKKLQASLDSQIRFLIKKCRTLMSSEYGHRGVAGVSSSPLFSLDASRAVVLLQKSLLHRGKLLDLVTNRLEDVWNSKLTWENFVPEIQNQNPTVDDIQVIKDFIFRQSDSLRGRVASATNTASGSAAAGVGMVAAAAAAAAASAAAGKPLSTPKLPSMDMWETFCNHALDTLISVKNHFVDDIDLVTKHPTLKGSSAVKVEGNSMVVNSAAETAISCLECNIWLNIRFSMEWCKRALSVAKEIYLRDLPTCYPTGLHKLQLDKALCAFLSMVNGPAVSSFSKKLEEECNAIWCSGRQLCDAVSLTGKPCIHQRHNEGSPRRATDRHSSGYVFLHACACGRSRRLRDDPFDLYDANVSFNQFPSCEKFLPALELPKCANINSLHSSWSLVRLGGVKYYDPSKGLLQSGFCSTERYLTEMILLLDKPEVEAGGLVLPNFTTCSSRDPTDSPSAEKKPNKLCDVEEIQVVDSTHQKDLSKSLSEESHVYSGKGFPSFIMKKAFSEVVAGTLLNDPVFPLQTEKHPTVAGIEKGDTLASNYSQGAIQIDLSNGNAKEETKVTTECHNTPLFSKTNVYTSDNPILEIGNNIVPMAMPDQHWVQTKPLEKNCSIYVGFEHECPYGHRYFLSEEHLNKLGSFYSFHKFFCSIGKESSETPSMVEFESKKNDGHIQMNFVKSNNNNEKELRSKFALPGPQARKFYQDPSFDEHKGSFQSVELNKEGPAVSLLNRNLPIYLNCPHCENFVEVNNQRIKYANTISQLQRIYMVTPSFPVVLATAPVIQFEMSHIPPHVENNEKLFQFSLGRRIILPPESFLSLRLPFIYGFQLEDCFHPLMFNKDNPELTAWLVKGTALTVVSTGFNVKED